LLRFLLPSYSETLRIFQRSRTSFLITLSDIHLRFLPFFSSIPCFPPLPSLPFDPLYSKISDSLVGGDYAGIPISPLRPFFFLPPLPNLCLLLCCLTNDGEVKGCCFHPQPFFSLSPPLTRICFQQRPFFLAWHSRGFRREFRDSLALFTPPLPTTSTHLQSSGITRAPFV